MQQETNIIEIVKSRRFITAALKLALTKKQRLKLMKKSRYITINPDDDSEHDSKINKLQKID